MRRDEVNGGAKWASFRAAHGGLAQSGVKKKERKDLGFGSEREEQERENRKGERWW